MIYRQFLSLSKILICYLFLVPIGKVFAQENLAHYKKVGIKKLKKKVKVLKHGRAHENGTGKYPALDVLSTPPGKIGFLSFYVFDPSSRTYQFFKEDSSGNLFNPISESLYLHSLHSIKKSFSQENMKFLLPKDYLDTEGKKQAYNDFYKELIGEDHYKKIYHNLNKKDQRTCTAKGFTLVPANIDYHSKLLSDKLALLLEKLDLDAALIVAQECFTDHHYTDIEYIEALIYGKNPISKQPSVSNEDYYPSMLFAGGFIDFKKSILISENHHNEIVTVSSDGYGIILQAIIEKALEDLNENIGI